MKHSATLINVSRAELVDQQALLEALESCRLWGAGLDVHPSEPTSAGDPILNHPRVVATPHTAGSTIDILVKSIDKSVGNLQRVARGLAPDFVVN
jgi:phosphoglycerate dehydrogenase-like enzyme